MDRKVHSKSIRLSDKVLQYIESVPGDGFNQKFENIIIEAMETVPQREKELAYYDGLIAKRKEQLSKIADKVESFDSAIKAVFAVQEDVRRIQRQIDSIINDS